MSLSLTLNVPCHCLPPPGDAGTTASFSLHRFPTFAFVASFSHYPYLATHLSRWCMYLDASCSRGRHGSSLVVASYVLNPTPCVLLSSLHGHSCSFDIARPSLTNIPCSLSVASRPSWPCVAEPSSARHRSDPRTHGTVVRARSRLFITFSCSHIFPSSSLLSLPSPPSQAL